VVDVVAIGLHRLAVDAAIKLGGKAGLPQQDALERDGVVYLPSDYGDEPYPITRRLIEEGREHLVLQSPIQITCPVRLLHGMKDTDVPCERALRISEMLVSTDVEVILVKDGDHRLSEPQDLERLCRVVSDLIRL